MKNALKKIYLFNELSPEELDSLTAISALTSYNKGSLLFMSGDIGEHLLILVKGNISVYKNDNKGNEIVIGHFTPYSLIAEAAILREIPFPSSAIFKSNGAVIKIKMKEFKNIFLSNPKISSEIIKSLLDKIKLLEQNIHLNISSTAKDKVLYLYETNASIIVKLKKYEIAALLGMTAETFSRTLNLLANENLLLKTKNGYQIVK